MFCTAKYENIKDNDLRLISISEDEGKKIGFTGETYKALAPRKDFSSKWHDNIGKISEEENNRFYIESYYKEVLSKLDINEVIKDLKYSILLCYENNNEFCHRHIVAAWFELILGIEIDEIKVNKDETIVLDRPSYIKDVLEEIMKENIDMKGFNSIEALCLYENSIMYEKQAEIFKNNKEQTIEKELLEISKELKSKSIEVEKAYKRKKRVR